MNNKISCDVISDLLPLYAEAMVTEDSKALIEEHLKECPSCREKLMNMEKTLEVPLEEDTAPLASIKKKLMQKKFMAIILTAVFAVGIMVLGYIHLTAPVPLAYDESLISIKKLEDGALLVTVSGQVDGYMFDRSSYGDMSEGSKDSAPYFYNITLWDSLWNRYISKNQERSFILNKDNRGGYYQVKAVYYYSSETGDKYQDDQLIYGSKSTSFAGVATLPRLALSYYFLLALGLSFAGCIILIAVRKNLRIRAVVFKIFLVPVSYMISQLCVKGMKFTTHTILKDFTGIILLMIPIYFVILIAVQLISSKKDNKSS